MYETGLPAKSDHFFTSASLMISLLFNTTMAEKTQQGYSCSSLLKPKDYMLFYSECVCVMKLCTITCISTFKSVDVPVPLCQIGQVNWKVIVCQLHHISYEKEAGRAWDGFNYSRFNYWMKEMRKTKVRPISSSSVLYFPVC